MTVRKLPKGAPSDKCFVLLLFFKISFFFKGILFIYVQFFVINCCLYFFSKIKLIRILDTKKNNNFFWDYLRQNGDNCQLGGPCEFLLTGPRQTLESPVLHSHTDMDGQMDLHKRAQWRTELMYVLIPVNRSSHVSHMASFKGKDLLEPSGTNIQSLSEQSSRDDAELYQQ